MVGDDCKQDFSDILGRIITMISPNESLELHISPNRIDAPVNFQLFSFFSGSIY
jgi:hypothetical protein